MKINTQIIRLVLTALIIHFCFYGFSQRKSSEPVIISNNQDINSVKTPNDTLLPGNLPNVISPEYVLIPSDNGGYILGTNGWNDKCKCQQFKVTYKYHIEGAIFWFGYKRADSAGLVKFTIWNMDGTDGTTHDTTGQPCPGTPFVSLSDTTTNIDTSSSPEQAYVVMFPFPVLVINDYCIGIDLSSIKEDSIALVSTNIGQGGNLELVWEKWSSNNKWYTLQGAQWDSGTIDVDAMILPIIDNTAGCIESGEFISGMKLNPSFPNPVDDFLTIQYELESNQDYSSLEIINLDGKRVYFNDHINQLKGIHQIVVDVSHFNNGTYIYILSTSEARMAKKMLISR